MGCRSAILLRKITSTTAIGLTFATLATAQTTQTAPTRVLMYGTVVDGAERRGQEAKVGAFNLLKRTPSEPSDCPAPEETMLDEVTSDVASGQFSIGLDPTLQRVTMRYCAGGYFARFVPLAVEAKKRIQPDPVKLLSTAAGKSSSNGTAITTLAVSQVLEDARRELAYLRETDPNNFQAAFAISRARHIVALLLKIDLPPSTGKPDVPVNRVTDVIIAAAADLAYFRGATPLYNAALKRLPADDQTIASMLQSAIATNDPPRSEAPSQMTKGAATPQSPPSPEAQPSSPTNPYPSAQSTPASVAKQEGRVTGCVQAGTSASSFELTNIKRGFQGTEASAGAPASSAPSKGRTVKLTASSGVDLAAHVGHTVEVMGVWSTGENAPAAASPGSTATGEFTVKNVKMVSSTCSAGTN